LTKMITTKFRFLRGFYRVGCGCERRIKVRVQGLLRTRKWALVLNGFEFVCFFLVKEQN